MDKKTKNNLIALMEECHVNGEHGAAALYSWYVEERDLIMDTLESLDDDERGIIRV